MAQDSTPSPMPAFSLRDEPVSVLAARAVRAGLIRRRAEALSRFGPAFSPTPHQQRGGTTLPSKAGETPSARDDEKRPMERNLFERGIPATGLQPPELAAFFQRWWPVVRAHTDTDRFRAESLLSVLWQTRDIAGDIVECGSYRGGLGFLFALAVQQWGLSKKVHLYDSFEGLPALAGEDRAGSEETMFFEGQFRVDDLIGSIRTFLDQHDLAAIVELHKGWFEQTLPRIPDRQRFSFAHIDCDLYESAQTCWTYLMPRASDGAGIVIDDYDSFGMYKATWEYLESAGNAYPLYVGALKQGHFFTTRGAPLAARAEDWSPLLANRPYCAYLANLCGEMILICSGPPNSPRDEKLIADLDRILGAQDKVPFLERFIGFLYHFE